MKVVVDSRDDMGKQTLNRFRKSGPEQRIHDDVDFRKPGFRNRPRVFVFDGRGWIPDRRQDVQVQPGVTGNLAGR